MTSFPLPKMSDVIGPICSGYVPFRNSSRVVAYSFSRRGCEIGRTRPMSGISVNPSYEINSRLKRKVLGGDRTAVSSWQNLRSERSSTVLAGPGKIFIYDYLLFFGLSTTNNVTFRVLNQKMLHPNFFCRMNQNISWMQHNID